jgi:PII-like signaling protein
MRRELGADRCGGTLRGSVWRRGSPSTAAASIVGGCQRSLPDDNATASDSEVENHAITTHRCSAPARLLDSWPVMRVDGTAQRLTIFIGEDDRYGRHPLYREIVRRAHEAGLAGATVLRGIEGYGASTHLHTTRILSLAEDLPLVVVIIDDPERIRGFLSDLDSIIEEGLVVLDDVAVNAYVDVAKSARRP